MTAEATYRETVSCIPRLSRASTQGGGTSAGGNPSQRAILVVEIPTPTLTRTSPHYFLDLLRRLLAFAGRSTAWATEAFKATASAASPLTRSSHLSCSPFRLPFWVIFRVSGVRVITKALSLIFSSRFSVLVSGVVTVQECWPSRTDCKAKRGLERERDLAA